jgi:hypothetical protein
MSFVYAVLVREEQVVGLFYFQVKNFSARESLNYEASSNGTISAKVKRLASSCIEVKGTVFGNLLVTGQHAYYLKPGLITQDSEWGLVAHTVNEVLKYAKKTGLPSKVLLCKDFTSSFILTDEAAWKSVKVQPNMVLHLNEEWKSWDDYLNALRSKYRKRIRSARRKIQTFEIKTLSVEEIKSNLDRIYELYLEIVQRAPFNMFILNRGYFSALKEYLGDNCDFTILEENGHLRAFQINIFNDGKLEAHFLGYDHQQVSSHDLYLNLLLLSVHKAIEHDCTEVIFSRTAMQIKSSIGAVPEDLYLYCFHSNKIVNLLFPRIIDRLNPPVVFDQRHPFK